MQCTCVFVIYLVFSTYTSLLFCVFVAGVVVKIRNWAVRCSQVAGRAFQHVARAYINRGTRKSTVPSVESEGPRRQPATPNKCGRQTRRYICSRIYIKRAPEAALQNKSCYHVEIRSAISQPTNDNDSNACSLRLTSMLVAAAAFFASSFAFSAANSLLTALPLLAPCRKKDLIREPRMNEKRSDNQRR